MKKILLLVFVLIMATVATFNLHLTENESGDLSLQNIEVLSFGETGSGSTCAGRGSVDCPRTSSKARYIW